MVAFAATSCNGGFVRLLPGQLLPPLLQILLRLLLHTLGFLACLASFTPNAGDLHEAPRAFMLPLFRQRTRERGEYA